MFYSSSLVLGSSDVVSLKVQVKNEGEPAYLSQLYVVLPQDVNFAQVPTGCTLELQKLKCLVGNNFIKGQTVSSMESFGGVLILERI